MEEVPCHFNLLPLEMIFEILELIPICAKKKARLVCNLWRMMIESQRSVIFRPKLTNNASMEYFLKSYRSMDNVIIRNINSRMSRADLEFPRVKNAELGWKNSEGNIERFLTQGCEYAESLTLAKFSLERISRGAISKTLSEINWKNLNRQLVITSNYKDKRARKHLRNVTTLLKYARISGLKELDFNFDFRYGFTKKHVVQYRKLFKGLYPFLVGHSKTLKMLTGRINTTSKRTLEIPEIPMDLQQSLESCNMKLEQCSLSLCGVRRFESIIYPDLFGTELKVLDIKILPSWSKHHPRFDVLARGSIFNFSYNLLLICKRNRKKLTNVSLNMHVYPLTFLTQCTALESLKLEGMLIVKEPTDLSQLSGIKLKSFSARFFYNRLEYLSPGLHQLLRQSVGTLEHLSLFRTHDVQIDEGRPIQFWLRDCVALKSLKIVHISKEYIEQNMDSQFPQLTELETFLTPENRLITSTWITESMRNLEKIAITGPYMDIELLRTLFTLPKLKQIIFADKERWSYLPPTNVIDEIKEFCAILEVTFTTVKDGRKIGHYGKMHVISMRANRFIVVNPISN